MQGLKGQLWLFFYFLAKTVIFLYCILGMILIICQEMDLIELLERKEKWQS